MKRLFILAVFITLSATLHGCGGGSGAPSSGPPQPLPHPPHATQTIIIEGVAH